MPAVPGGRRSGLLAPQQAQRRRNVACVLPYDRDELSFPSLIRPAGKDGTQTQETQFNKYQKLGGGWMAPEVIFMIDGKVLTTEKYSDMRADVNLNPKLFDPQFWTAVHWKE